MDGCVANPHLAVQRDRRRTQIGSGDYVMLENDAWMVSTVTVPADFGGDAAGYE